MRISELEIENFKLFDEHFQLGSQEDSLRANLSGSDIIVLNGPNGYGKTSIFDAIEFALTGKIKRINHYNEALGVTKSELYDKKILIADETKESCVGLTLVEGECTIKIQYLCPPVKKNEKTKATKENNPIKIFEHFNRTIFLNDKTIENKSEQETILQQYGLNDMDEFFDKCCFLSQDEHLNFLKEAKNNKAAALEFLFSVPEEQKKELERVNHIIDSLRNRNTKYNIGLLDELEKRENDLNIAISGQKLIDSGYNENEKGQVSYVRLFPQREVKWDEEELMLEKEEYDDSMNEIDTLIYFSEQKEMCKNYVFNKPYQDMIKAFSGDEKITYADNPLEYAYRYYALLLEEETIEQKYLTEQKYWTLITCLEKREFGNINWKFVSDEELLNDNEVSVIKSELNQVADLQNTQGVTSKVISNITHAREAFLAYTEKAMDEGMIVDASCPLCGAPYGDRKILDEKIKIETEVLQKLCDDSGIKIKNIIDDIYKKYFDNLTKKAQLKLEKPIPEYLYEKLQEIKKYKAKILEVNRMLQNIGIQIPEKYQEDIQQINIGYEELMKDIKAKCKIIPEEIAIQLEVKDFMDYYDKFYNKDEKLFEGMENVVLLSKKQFVKNKFFDRNKKQLKDNEKELIKVHGRIEELKKIYDDLCTYQTAINQGISAYKKKIISDIEPLLYVYTAKILQQKFNGKSIFISADENMTKIQLINSMQDKQDILYNMSSGQLAAVAISFLMCMNQVYMGSKVFPILMIDDPIQTIDDVNMVGLVDILRYEFADRQIIISTHEQKFDWYLRYKYERARKKIFPINMKERILNG